MVQYLKNSLLLMLLLFSGTVMTWSLPGLTPLEKQKLLSLSSPARPIRVSPAPAFPPFDIVSGEKQYTGLSADYLNLIAEVLEVDFEIVPAETLKDALRALEERKVDLVTSIAYTADRSRYAEFTQSYLSIPVVVLGGPGLDESRTSGDLSGMTLAVGDQYAVVSHLVCEYPGTRLYPVKDDWQGLQNASLGLVDGVVIDRATAGYILNVELFSQMKQLKTLDYNYDLRFGVRSDDPVLRDLLDKALGAIPLKNKKELQRKWLSEPRKSFFRRVGLF